MAHWLLFGAIEAVSLCNDLCSRTLLESCLCFGHGAGSRTWRLLLQSKDAELLRATAGTAQRRRNAVLLWPRC